MWMIHLHVNQKSDYDDMMMMARMERSGVTVVEVDYLTLKAPITTAADDKNYATFFLIFRKNNE